MKLKGYYDLWTGVHDWAEAQLGFWRAGNVLFLHLGGSYAHVSAWLHT